MSSETDLKLKAATRDLVALAGGPSRAEKLTRGSQSRFSEYGAPHNFERFICVDQVLALETECGEPVLTRALADAEGFDLVAREAQPSTAKRLHQALSDVITETSAVSAELASAMADGRIDERERAAILRKIEEAVTGLNALRVDLRAGLRAVS